MKPASIKVTSPAFVHGEWIPRKYTGEGADVSPSLFWAGIPAETREIAVICDDPDAPTPEPWVHWVIYGIPAGVDGLPEGVPGHLRLASPSGAMQGKNSWDAEPTIGYRGPMPPPGKPHRYYFKIYALGAESGLQPGAEKHALLAAIREHILAEGELMGQYQR